MDLDLSMVSDDGFQCYNTADTNIDDELQLLPKETTLTPETVMKTEQNSPIEPHRMLRRSQRLLFAKQTEKLSGVPYYSENNKKIKSNHCVLQENQSS